MTCGRNAGPVDLDPGLGRRGPGPGRQPGELGAAELVELEPGPQDAGVDRPREGAAAGDPGVEGGPLRRGPGQPLDQVVDPALRHDGEERERDVHLLGGRPAEVGRLAAYVEELVEVLDRLVGRLDRHEHPAHRLTSGR